MGSEYLILAALPPAIALGVWWERAWLKVAEQNDCYHDWEDKNLHSSYGSDPYKECRLCGKQDHTPPRD